MYKSYNTFYLSVSPTPPHSPRTVKATAEMSLVISLHLILVHSVYPLHQWPSSHIWSFNFTCVQSFKLILTTYPNHLSLTYFIHSTNQFISFDVAPMIILMYTLIALSNLSWQPTHFSSVTCLHWIYLQLFYCIPNHISDAYVRITGLEQFVIPSQSSTLTFFPFIILSSIPILPVCLSLLLSWWFTCYIIYFNNPVWTCAPSTTHDSFACAQEEVTSTNLKWCLFPGRSDTCLSCLDILVYSYILYSSNGL